MMRARPCPRAASGRYYQYVKLQILTIQMLILQLKGKKGRGSRWMKSEALPSLLHLLFTPFLVFIFSSSLFFLLLFQSLLLFSTLTLLTNLLACILPASIRSSNSAQKRNRTMRQAEEAP
eukprot:g16527.t1